MPKDENYALIMLDINSTNEEIKLNALDKIGTFDQKEDYIPALEKVSKSKNQILKEKALAILHSIPSYKDTSDMIDSNFPHKEATFEDINKKFNGLIELKDFDYFKPYINREGSKQVHLPTEVREEIQRLLNSESTLIKLKVLFPVLYLPLEHKYKVTILVDLLRDKTPEVIAYTLKHLDEVDKLSVKKLTPIIINRFNHKDDTVKNELINFLFRLDKELFESEIQLIAKEGLLAKTQKKLTDKLLSALS